MEQNQLTRYAKVDFYDPSVIIRHKPKKAQQVIRSCAQQSALVLARKYGISMDQLVNSVEQIELVNVVEEEGISIDLLNANDDQEGINSFYKRFADKFFAADAYHLYHHEIKKALKTDTFNINFFDNDGKTLLHRAAESYPKKCPILLKNGAIITQKIINSACSETVRDLLQTTMDSLRTSARRAALLKSKTGIRKFYDPSKIVRVGSKGNKCSPPIFVYCSASLTFKHRINKAIINKITTLEPDERRANLFFNYIKDNQLSSAKILLTDTPKLAHMPCGEKALLHVIDTSKHSDYIEMLLVHKVNPNVLIDGDDCLLHRVKGQRSAQLLVDHGANVHHKNKKGATPLFTVIQDSLLEEIRFDIASILLKAGADVNAIDAKKNSPLDYAVMNVDPKAIKFLLYCEADPNRFNGKLRTAYQMALKKGGIVLQAFEECKKIFSVINAMVENNKNYTIMSLLMDDGRQLKNILQCDYSGHCSADIVIAEKLLQQCDNDVWDELGISYSSCSKELIVLAKLIAERSRHRDSFLRELRDANFLFARRLLEANPYLLYTYYNEYSSDEVSNVLADKFLSIFTYSPDYQHLRYLFCECFDVDRCDEQKKTLLYQLLMDGSLKSVDLLRVGFNVNVVDENGKTPLAHALLSGKQERVERLLHYGAVVQSGMLDTGKAIFLNDLLLKTFYLQRCYGCEDHPEDISIIPCIKKHVDKFICKSCYRKANGKCPCCKRDLEPYGSA